MNFFNGYQHYFEKSDKSCKSVVAIGNFDGLHYGHQQIFLKLVETKQRLNLKKAIVYTFWPHPREVVSPHHQSYYLMEKNQRLEKTKGIGIFSTITDWVEENFNSEFASISPEEFIERILVNMLQVKAVVVGFDFCFGKLRTGSLGVLKEYAKKYDFELIVVEEVKLSLGKLSETRISSSMIRNLLMSGEIETANQALSGVLSSKLANQYSPWPFTIHSKSQPGFARGRKLGFPTINCLWSAEFQNQMKQVMLPFGVYFTSIQLEPHGQFFPAISNFGVRPTLFHENEKPLIETHVLNVQNLNIPAGTWVAISFYKKLRNEIKFQDDAHSSKIEKLRQQIDSDVLAAREYFAHWSSLA